MQALQALAMQVVLLYNSIMTRTSLLALHNADER